MTRAVSSRLSLALLAFTAASVSASTARADDETAPPPDAPAEGPTEAPTAPETSPDAPLPPPETPPVPQPAGATRAPDEGAVPPRFGAAGQVVVMAGFGLEIGVTAYSRGEAKRFGASVSPGLDVFVVDRFSVGASLYVSHVVDRSYDSSGGLIEQTSTVVGFGPRLGHAVPLGRYFSLYPRMTIGFRHASTKGERLTNGSNPFASDSTGRRDDNDTKPYVYLIAPLLIHPSPSFFVGAGPSIFHEISISGATTEKSRTTGSFETVVGGHWGGTPDPENASEAPLPDPTKRYRFGERKDVLLGGDFYVGAAYASAEESSASVVVSPSFDYFIVDHLAIGAGVGFDHSWTSLQSARSGERTTTNFHGLVRVGVQASLSARLSFFPRGSFRMSYGSSDDGGTFTNEIITTRLALDLPLVFHVAPHFYVGLGPFIGRDVSRVVNGASSKALGTSGGLTTLLGGWL